MSKLYLYGIFHGNLSFSYIPTDLYGQIIERCYWPLLEIIQHQKVPFGIELPAFTLQMINRIDPRWVRKLAELWENGYCQFIGSGYIQSIMPLIPYEANLKNLHYGNEVYKNLLGKAPNMAFVNEQVFSQSLPEIYRSANYESLIVNWDSALPLQLNQDLKYKTCKIKLNGVNSHIPILWHYTTAYRNLQNYIEQKSSLNDYTEWLDSNIPKSGYRTLAFYSSDLEVFDFKPWDPNPEGFPSPYQGEMNRLSGLIDLLLDRDDVTFISPDEAINMFSDKPEVNPTSSSNPLPYKKQDQHGMLRWAVGGREAVRFNTQCYELYTELINADTAIAHSTKDLHLEKTATSDIWRELCYLWSSDFRTFTTEDKYIEFRNRIGAALNQIHTLKTQLIDSSKSSDQVTISNNSSVFANSQVIDFTLTTNKSNRVYISLDNGEIKPCQLTNQSKFPGTQNYITQLTIPPEEYRTANIIIQDIENSKHISEYSIDPYANTISTPSVKLSINPNKGGIIDSIIFPRISETPLITNKDILRQRLSIEEDISGADIYVYDGRETHIGSDNNAQMIYPEYANPFPIFVPILCKIITGLGVIWKTFRVYIDVPRVDLQIRFQWRDVVPKSFRIGNMSLEPDAFDEETLQYITNNGGINDELFYIGDSIINHGAPMQNNVTAHTSIGATEGWTVLRDSSKGVGFITNQSMLYSVPMISYKNYGDANGSFIYSIEHSLTEQDPTTHVLWRGHNTWQVSILGGNKNIVEETKQAALSYNGRINIRQNVNILD